MSFPFTYTRCLSACEKDKFDVILGHGEEGEEEGEVLLTFTINDRFSSEEMQGGLSISIQECFDPTLKCFYQQYVIYDFNSFMADWGGYMGLVLGYREKLTGSVILRLNLQSYRSYLVL